MDMKNLDLKYFLIILIVVLLGYLIYINYIENKTIESFQVRNSLSSYFQSDDDFQSDNDLLMDNTTNEFRQTLNDTSYVPSSWNGSYKFEDEDEKINYITFLQINKDVLFVINLVNYNIGGDNPDPYVLADKDKPQCLPGMLIARGELNHAETLFYMKEIYCSNNKDATGGFNPFGEAIDDSTINSFYCYIHSDGNIHMVQMKEDGSGEEGSAILTKEPSYKFGPSAQYLLRTSYNIPAPNVKNSIKVEPDVCLNTTFDSFNKGELEDCYIGTDGLPTPDDQTSFTDANGQKYQYNVYGTGCAKKGTTTSHSYGDGSIYKKCPTNISETCFIPIKDMNKNQSLDKVGDYTKCETNFTLKVNNQSSVMHPYYLKENTSGNLLNLCDHLEGFQSKKYNSAILMYVDNLSDVQSLNFDFFGIEKGQNYLTTKLDIMFPFMNNHILNKYRSTMSDEKSLRLTNCIENNMAIKSYNQILNQCSGKYDEVSEKYEMLKESIMKNSDKHTSDTFKEYENIMGKIDVKANQRKATKLINPTVWNLNFLDNESNKTNLPDYTNDCSFILSTVDKYNKEGRFQKYAEFDSQNGTTKLNLFKGGNKQRLVLENQYVLDSLEEKLGTTEYNSGNGVNNDNNISNEYILLTGNLKTYHPKKYLVPGQGHKFNPFGKQIYLQNEVRDTGKWVILGFNLTNNLDNGLSQDSYNSTLIRTLKKISDTMNS